MKRIVARTVWALVAVLTARSLSGADVSVNEERIRNTSLSPEYAETWRSSYLRLGEKEDLEETAEEIVACYRKDFELSAAPRRAELALRFRRTPYWLTINGTTVLEPTAHRLQKEFLVTLDITDHLHEGHNVLTFRRPLSARRKGYWAQSFLVAEGIVFCKDGTTKRILSDGWRGGWDLPEGWDDPAADPQQFPAVRAGKRPVRGRPDAAPMRPYYGPIQVAPRAPDGREMDEPIFNVGAPVALDVLLLNERGPGLATPALTVEVMDEFSREVIAEREVALAEEGRFDLAGQVRMEALPQGAYRFRFVLAREGEAVDRCDFEAASVGKIEQRLVQGTHYEDGLDLREVWSVDCTQEPESDDAFVAAHTIWDQTPEAGVRTEVIEGPAGRYRTLMDNGRMHYFAYRYRLDNLWTPHLAVVEWPDDARREFNTLVVEAASGFPDHRSYRRWENGGVQRAESSVVARHDMHPERSNQMRKLHMLFWPNALDGSVHIANVGGGAPAAAARITIYEITNDLPALQVADAGDRVIGPVTERGPTTMARTYYAGPLGAYFQNRLSIEGRGSPRHAEFYRNWYTTTENLIKRMRFSGQNAYFMGHLMYNNVLFPSELGLFRGSSQTCDAELDYNPLILRMFECNDMYMVSGIEIASLPAFVSGMQTITEEDIQAGNVSPMLSISREGTVFPFHSARLKSQGAGRGSVLNYFHPEVQAAVIETVGELADLYGEYPAWRGVLPQPMSGPDGSGAAVQRRTDDERV